MKSTTKDNWSSKEKRVCACCMESKRGLSLLSNSLLERLCVLMVVFIQERDSSHRYDLDQGQSDVLCVRLFSQLQGEKMLVYTTSDQQSMRCSTFLCAGKDPFHRTHSSITELHWRISIVFSTNGTPSKGENFSMIVEDDRTDDKHSRCTRHKRQRQWYNDKHWLKNDKDKTSTKTRETSLFRRRCLARRGQCSRKVSLVVCLSACQRLVENVVLLIGGIDRRRKTRRHRDERARKQRRVTADRIEIRWSSWPDEQTFVCRCCFQPNDKTSRANSPRQHY